MYNVSRNATAYSVSEKFTVYKKVPSFAICFWISRDGRSEHNQNLLMSIELLFLKTFNSQTLTNSFHSVYNRTGYHTNTIMWQASNSRTKHSAFMPQVTGFATKQLACIFTHYVLAGSFRCPGLSVFVRPLIQVTRAAWE